MKENIVLIGFRGTGKTRVGRMLAKRLGLGFVDTDNEIVRKEGKEIPKIFECVGEEGFRNIEEKVVEKVSGMKGVCVSCGGGVVLRKTNVENLRKNSVIVLLESDPKTIYARIYKDKNRPKLTDKECLEEIQHLLEERKPLYDSSADIKVDSGNSLDECVQKIIDALYEEGYV